MSQRRLLFAFLLLLTVALFGAWWLMRPPAAQPEFDNEPLAEDTERGRPDLLEVERDDDSEVSYTGPEDDDVSPGPSYDDEPDAESEDEPALHAPDYGIALQRGGGVVNFELYDAQGLRVPVSGFQARLWRKVGRYWLRDEVDVDSDADLVRCNGMGDHAIPPTGLEPGDYELELLSKRWGNLRHSFSVRRGELRTDRLTTPLYRRKVAIKLVDQYGEPVPYIGRSPSVVVDVVPLTEKQHSAQGFLELRNPPMQPDSTIGVGWGSSGRPSGRMTRDFVQRTDEGRWWVHVYAGATNTVRFKFEEGYWGQESAEIVSDFSFGEEFEIQLNLVEGFKEKIEEWGKIHGGEPGNRDLGVEKHKEGKAVDPYTDPVESWQTRVIMEVDSEIEVSVQFSRSTSEPFRYGGSFHERNGVFWYEFSSNAQVHVRVTDNNLYASPWRKVELPKGQTVTLQHSVSGPRVRIDTNALSPTLRAFAYQLDIGIAYRLDPDKSEKTMEAQGDALRSNRFKAPSGYEMLKTLVVHMGKHPGTLAAGHKVETADLSHGLVVRTELRGASRFRRPRSGGATCGPDGRGPYDPKELRGDWQQVETGGQSMGALLQNGLLRPRVHNVLSARAVGPLTEGLPWVSGVILDYEHDELAQQVRELSRTLDEEQARPRMSLGDPDTWEETINAMEKSPESDCLRELMGEANYEAFETDEQRVWFARHGAWYDTSRKVFSDEHGYIVKQRTGLDPGRIYVLYLWSNSRDDLYPDARVVFKVDEEGNADLGAIHLPAFAD